eukprot:3190258-Rhodomonas_salina.4
MLARYQARGSERIAVQVYSAILLRARYAKPGTDVRYCPTSLDSHLLSSVAPPLSSYARATQCPVLT